MSSSITLYCAITAKNGARVSLEVEPETTSTELREKVSEVTKIPLGDLRLIFRGKMIKDESVKAVESYKLEHECVLHCMGKPSHGDLPSRSAPVPAIATAAAVPTSVPTGTSAARPQASASATADPVQQALQTLRASNPPQVYSTAMTTLAKILSNIMDHPMEEKYRKVKKANAAFGKKLGGLPGGDAAMKAVGFVLEQQDGAEVYQIHASPEAWPKVMAAKAAVDAAAAEASRSFTVRPPPPMPGANTMFPGMSGMPSAFPGMGAMPEAAAAGMNNPAMQNAMAEMMSNPEAVRNMLQNPMVQQMIQNDPNLSPMHRNMMQQLANNPNMFNQLSTMMADPAMRSRMQSMIGASAGLPGANGWAGQSVGTTNAVAPAGGSSNNDTSSNGQHQDQDQTEDEMIAEAIRRSLEES